MKLYENLRKRAFNISMPTGQPNIPILNKFKVTLDPKIAKKYPQWFKEVIVKKLEVIEVDIDTIVVEDDKDKNPEVIEDLIIYEDEIPNKIDAFDNVKDLIIDKVVEEENTLEDDGSEVDEDPIVDENGSDSFDPDDVTNDSIFDGAKEINDKKDLDAYALIFDIKLDRRMSLEKMKEDFKIKLEIQDSK